MIRRLIASLALTAGLVGVVPAQQAAPVDSSLLTVERIYGTPELRSQSFGPMRWLAGGAAYTTLERSAAGPGQDLVRYDAATGTREILIAAARLVAPGDTTPLEVE
ncbi:MAG: hypothetical protein ACREMR_04160, partial [Gemmatimonadales bacterium]